MNTLDKNVYENYAECKANRERYKPLWDKISKYTGINVQPDYMWNNNNNQKDRQLDLYVDDPTAATSVNQSGDYLVGILWGTGSQAFEIVPSRHVRELIEDEMVIDKYYNTVTENALFHMNHVNAGFSTALKPYAYDQQSFGTSGIGVFPNPSFTDGIEDNALVFRNYGIDSICIAEGKSGLVDTVFATYFWKLSRIIAEFCMTDGEIDKAKIERLPKKIRDAHANNKLNETFTLVNGIIPRQDYNPKLKGKRGAKYQGFWFLDDPKDNLIFSQDDFPERPINVCRQIKVRGEVYGRSSGTMLFSTIRSVNFMVGTVIEILEKMGKPSLGIYGNSLFGDSVLDDSPNGLTVFNSDFAMNKTPPTFPLYTVGDPTGIVQFLIPYLNDKITTAFKVDVLLDFASAREMTATESMQRYAIRGKSLSGLLQQQKIEMLEPTVRRVISILDGVGELGVNPETEPERAASLYERRRDELVIPAEVLEVKNAGKPWYEIKFNNELEKLVNTEKVQELLQLAQTVGMIATLNPDIVYAVDWHKMLSDINEMLDVNNQIVMDADTFKELMVKVGEQRAAQASAQLGQAGAQISKDMSQANKNNQEASNAPTR